MSGLLHAAALYSLTKLPEIPAKTEEYVRIDIGRIAFLKEEKVKTPPKAVTKKNKAQRRKVSKKPKLKPKKVKVARLKKRKVEKRRKPVRKVKALSEDVRPARSVSSERLLVSSGVKNTNKEAVKNTAGGGSSTVKGKNKGESRAVALSTPRVRESYGEVYRKLNLSKIRKLVQESISYPYVARRMGWEGRVSVEVVLTPEGCKEVNLKEGTGYRVLDRNALETVRKLCGKFPKPKREVVLLIPIVYKLN